jgi:small-conductance mechanosensitive channel
MNIDQLLQYELLATEKFDITVFELIGVFIIFSVTLILVYGLKLIFRRIERKRPEETGRRHALLQIVKYVMWLLAFTASLQVLDIEITLILAGSAALLVGLGLGLQQIFQDVMSGVAMLFEGSLRMGDIVELDNGTVGKVKEINLRTTKIESRDNIIMIVPNSRFINDNVINWSHINKNTRFYVKVGVAYGSDVNLVTDILLKCVNQHRLVSNKPKPFVRFLDFGESSLDFQVFFWSHENFLVENIKSDIRYAVNKAFIENNVRIPFPQHDVYINPHEKE